MKRITMLIISLLLCCFTLTSCYNAPKNDITVYKTEAGQKYHRENCRYVKGKAIEIKLSRALYDGYTPCLVCKPPVQKYLDDINKK